MMIPLFLPERKGSILFRHDSAMCDARLGVPDQSLLSFFFPHHFYSLAFVVALGVFCYSVKHYFFLLLLLAIIDGTAVY